MFTVSSFTLCDNSATTKWDSSHTGTKVYKKSYQMWSITDFEVCV